MEPRWDRLAQAVEARRASRAWSQKKVRQQGGPSDTLQSEIEQNRWRPTRGVDETLAKIDKGLLWLPGSASRVLAGGDPSPIETLSDFPDLGTFDPPPPDPEGYTSSDDLGLIESLVEVMTFAAEVGTDGERAWSSSLHAAFRVIAVTAIRLGEELRACDTQKADVSEIAGWLRSYCMHFWRLERSTFGLLELVAAAAGEPALLSNDSNTTVDPAEDDDPKAGPAGGIQLLSATPDELVTETVLPTEVASERTPTWAQWSSAPEAAHLDFDTEESKQVLAELEKLPRQDFGRLLEGFKHEPQFTKLWESMCEFKFGADADPLVARPTPADHPKGHSKESVAGGDECQDPGGLHDGGT